MRASPVDASCSTLQYVLSVCTCLVEANKKAKDTREWAVYILKPFERAIEP